MQLYELVESLYKTFGIIEDIYTNFFLDTVLKYTEKCCHLSEFIEWWDENKKNNCGSRWCEWPQVMTIHKSKGLALM